MKLPSMEYADKIKKASQVEFGGYNHTLAAGDGELYDMRNLSSLYAPLLSPRPPRLLYRRLATPNGIFAKDALCWVDGTEFYYDDEYKGEVEDGKKFFTSLGVYIVIFPDKAYYNTLTDEFGSLESGFTSEPGGVTFTNGMLYDEEAECNTIEVAGVDFNEYFSAGDAVTVSGCTIHEENNKTPVIREISEDGTKLYFYEYIFTLDGEDGNEPYYEPGQVKIERTAPDLTCVCENENRLWGAAGDTIYCCKLGDIFNWNVFDGLGTDAYAVDVGSAGDFTGCVSYLGYPVFFKPGNVYKVYGSLPSNYEVLGSATLGVEAGASLAIAGETLFYLSRPGVCAFQGGLPTPVNEPFGTVRYKNAVGGSDGLKYYVSMQDDGGGWSLFVFDTRQGLWHREDETEAIGFAFTDNLYMLTAAGEIWITGNISDPPEAAMEEDGFEWMAEFGDFTDGEPGKKGSVKLQLRVELDAGASVNVQMKFDSLTTWLTVDTLFTEVKRSYYLPVIPRRADHYRIRLVGMGGFRLYSMTREYYSGSQLKSARGRN